MSIRAFLLTSFIRERDRSLICSLGRPSFLSYPTERHSTSRLSEDPTVPRKPSTTNRTARSSEARDFSNASLPCRKNQSLFNSDGSRSLPFCVNDSRNKVKNLDEMAEFPCVVNGYAAGRSEAVTEKSVLHAHFPKQGCFQWTADFCSGPASVYLSRFYKRQLLEKLWPLDRLPFVVGS